MLWDIRVRPDVRRHGFGHLLFEAAANAARRWQYRLLKVEFPDEIQLLRYLEL